MMKKHPIWILKGLFFPSEGGSIVCFRDIRFIFLPAGYLAKRPILVHLTSFAAHLPEEDQLQHTCMLMRFSFRPPTEVMPLIY